MDNRFINPSENQAQQETKLFENYLQQIMEQNKKYQNLQQELLQEDNKSLRTTKTRSTLAQHDPNQKQNKPKAKNPQQTFWRLFKYTWNYKGLLILANVGMIVSSAGFVLLPLICGKFIDNIKQGESLTENTINFIILTVLMAIFAAIRGFGFNLLGQLIVKDLRNQLFTQLVEKDIAYYDKNKTGQLISRLTSDVTVVESAASDNLSMLIRNLVQFLGSLIFLFLISWKLTVLIIIITPIISFSILFIIRVLKKYQKQYQNNLAFANSLANQVFGNIRVVKSFANQQNQSNNYGHLIEKTYTVGKKKSFFYAIMLLVMTLFGNFLILSILYFGGDLTINGQLSIGDLASYVLYTVTLTVGFASVSGIINQIVSALGVCEHLFNILDEPITIISGTQKPFVNNKQQQTIVQFKNATFCYPTKDNVNVLSNFDLKIKKGQSLAIVGSSGSGKSSIISLIMRFYDLKSGELLISGKNIKTLQLEDLRRNIGFVSQQPTLFSGSLKQNIQYGIKDQEKSLEKVMKALQIANAKGFVLNQETFPQKLDTLVGERGVKLSGGQKQRIAIARCVIKDPSLLIFDEATSALDAQSQHLVQKAIDGLVQAKQNTMIVVAHRLSTIINCDRIVVLQQGQIVEEGSHQQLLQKNGYYKNLVEKQLSSLS